MRIGTRLCRLGNLIGGCAIAVWFLLAPAAIILWQLRDPALAGPGIPRCASWWHQRLTPRQAAWADGRVESGRAAGLEIEDISGTEWPLFGTVFYLWATEAIAAGTVPDAATGAAVAASARLIADPNHAAWVRAHWGDDHLHRQNVFYRELLMAGLASHRRLTGDTRWDDLLRDQADSFSAELDSSPHGLLEDYPDQCFPTDICGAIAAVAQVDAVLGSDHGARIQRALRGFTGPRADRHGLPAYMADALSGAALTSSRGCSTSYILIWASRLWPEQARRWYADYERTSWQRRWLGDGFREFPRGEPLGDWFMDVDSGPVIAGHGIAASAFGVGAARANGRFDHAYALSAELLVTAWPLPDGSLLIPRMLSDASHAPLLGESGILFALTRQPETGVPIVPAAGLPPFVWLMLGGYVLAGLGVCALLLRDWLRWERGGRNASSVRRRALWTVLAGAAVLLVWWHLGAALLCALLAQACLGPPSPRPSKDLLPVS